MLPEYLTQLDFDFYYRCIGVVGFVIYMLSFAALQLQWISGESMTYTLANMIAAAMVLLSLSVEWNLSSALIQIAWIGIGLIGLLKRWRKKSTQMTLKKTSHDKANV